MPIAICALAVMLGSAMDASVKWLAQSSPLLHIIALRYGFGALIAITAYVSPKRLPDGSRVRRGWPSKASFKVQSIRSLFLLSTAYLFFFGLTQLNLATATTLGFTSALMVPLIAWPILGERPSAFACLCSLVGLAGAALAVSSQSAAPISADANPLLGAGCCLLAALFYAGVLVLLRLRAREDGPITTSLFSNVVPACVLMPISFSQGVIALPLDVIAATAGIGLLGFGIWFFMSIAYANAPAQRLAPFEYTALIWASALGYALFNERPTWQLLAGSAVIIAACLAVAMQSHFQTRRLAKISASDILD